MKINIDTESGLVVCSSADGQTKQFPLYSKEGLKAVSEIWLKQEWNQAHWKSFSWLGFQIYQFPVDLLRLQEIVFRIKPDVIVETGVHQGGSAIFFASLCGHIGKGRVISIDISIPHSVREAVEGNPYGKSITLLEGDSASPEIVSQVRERIGKNEKTFFFFDSDHSKAHVLRELTAYADMVPVGAYMVATDGVMRSLHDVPNGQKEWLNDNPASAAKDFVRANSNFVLQRPPALYGEEHVIEDLTYWPDAWLKRIS